MRRVAPLAPAALPPAGRSLPPGRRLPKLLLDLASRRLLHRLAHHLLKDRQECLRGERAQPLERVAHLRPVLLGAPGTVEWLPDVLQEDLDEHARHTARVAAHLLADLQPP